MIKRRLLLATLFLLIALLLGCNNKPTPLPTNTPVPTPTLSQVPISTTKTPDPNQTARTYLDAWKKEDYLSMYAMLTSVSKEAITTEVFTTTYTSVTTEAALSKGIDYDILSSLVKSPYSAQVAYRVTLHSVLVGDIQRDTVMNLSLEEGQWRVQWDDALILPELSGGNHLQMDYRVPTRANIYDRNGHALVAQSEAVSIALNAAEIDPEQEDALIGELFRLTGIQPDQLRSEIDNYRNHNWYLPITDVSTEALSGRLGILTSFYGVILSEFKSRYYFDGGPSSIAPHVTGYMSLIQPSEVDYFKRLGYAWNERVGRDGLEKWGEPYLAGKRGGVLHVMNSAGLKVTTLADIPSEPSQEIYTTIDKDLQKGAQQAIAGFKGAIVVLEKNTGRVLAMVSSPGFDPNLFEPENANRSYVDYLMKSLYSSDAPMFNRATQGQYPLGSVFKLVTISAALQSGVYTKDSTYECGYQFKELFGVTLDDWTYEHFLKDGRTQPSGLLTLPEGLMRSCNPFFWHIGLDLYNQGMTTTISMMARKFGLGTKTGIELTEEAGQITDPYSPIDATNNAIGQGATQVTPLQVASFVAALGNGGILYRPTVIEKIAPPNGDPTYVFTSTIQGRLPISSTNLTLIQEAMVSVIQNPRGTAHHRFLNFQIPIAGKTGTAQDPPRDSHAWFVAYSFANNPDKPDIAIAVIVENQGEGSDWAAPICRRVLEIYFYGKPLSIYWWESGIGVVRTATPEVTETPTPTPEP